MNLILMFFCQTDNDPVSRTTSINSGLPYLITQMSVAERIQLGYSLSDIMFHCTFDGYKCDEYNLCIHLFVHIYCII